MKKFLTILLAFLTVSVFAAGAQNEKKKASNLAEVTFTTTIDCKNCVKKVEANLPFESGIKDMKVDLPSKSIWIKYDSSKTTVEKLAKAIEKLGYNAVEKKEECTK